jgi:hypothetical protein
LILAETGDKLFGLGLLKFFDWEIWQYIDWIVFKTGGKNLFVLGDLKERTLAELGMAKLTLYVSLVFWRKLVKIEVKISGSE